MPVVTLQVSPVAVLPRGMARTHSVLVPCRGEEEEWQQLGTLLLPIRRSKGEKSRWGQATRGHGNKGSEKGGSMAQGGWNNAL